jgi:hypothetical protein
MDRLGTKTVMGAMLICGLLVIVGRIEKGESLFSFQYIEALFFVFMFLAIMATFAPELAGAIAIAATAVLVITTGGPIMKNIQKG